MKAYKYFHNIKRNVSILPLHFPLWNLYPEPQDKGLFMGFLVFLEGLQLPVIIHSAETGAGGATSSISASLNILGGSKNWRPIGHQWFDDHTEIIVTSNSYTVIFLYWGKLNEFSLV